jgi:lauroyl/myristoyl acyltransferase
MEFLGKKTHPDRMLKVLCKKTGAVLLLGLLERDGKGKYNLVLHRVPEEGEIPSNVCTLKLLEKYIYRHPEQWYEWKKYDHIACVN